MEKKTFVTKPSLPPLKEFLPYLEEIWESSWLTNNGHFHEKFEKELAEYLGVKYISLFTNGTLALITALQALEITGEVITTPYSFVATTHSLYWNNIKPVFIDIEKDSFNLDPEKIEKAITPNTTAILPVHVYGIPCNVDKIKKIAETHDLKVIYDAAHAFDVKIKNNSILNFGDLSILSFHATKVFNTFEGGAIICHDSKTKERIDFLKNFGFADETTVIGHGINAKMNEFQSALGLLQLKHVSRFIVKRGEIYYQYKELLNKIDGIVFQEYYNKDFTKNYSYVPVLVDEDQYGISRDDLYEFLKTKGIYSRRYFYPLISSFPLYKDLKSSNSKNLPNAELISRKILCLPIYDTLDHKTVKEICNFIRNKK